MLVLSRKLNEQIVIGDEVVITVVRVQGDKVSLGFEAAPEIPICRKEVYDKEELQGSKEEMVHAVAPCA